MKLESLILCSLRTMVFKCFLRSCFCFFSVKLSNDVGNTDLQSPFNFVNCIQGEIFLILHPFIHLLWADVQFFRLVFLEKAPVL